jgi:hypothetical protein
MFFRSKLGYRSMKRQITTMDGFPIGRFKAALLLTLGAMLFSSAASAASTFVLESPGVVLDTVNNLQWEQDASAQGRNINRVDFFGAQAYVNGLALDAAGGPWRLPTAAELRALYADLAATGVCGHNIDCTGGRAPFSNIRDNYWSSSASTRPGAYMEAVSFLSGGQGPAPVDLGIAVWAVRVNSLSGVPEPASGMLAMASFGLLVVLVRCRQGG